MPRRKHQRGTFAVMTVVLVLIILYFCGLVVDLGRMYNRKVELQTAADTIALAAAVKLNGTTEGVDAALLAAEQVSENLLYEYNNSAVAWSQNAIKFGTLPGGDTWLDADTARQSTNAPKLFYVRVDTSSLDPSPGTVSLWFLHLLPSVRLTALVNSKAIAGRESINVMPLAICAMSETRGEARGTELVEYGYRRGVSYNLMKLNPNGTADGANYLINPLAPPGVAGASVMARMDVVRPFVCTGTLAMPTLAGGTVSVELGFPLESVFEQLNSRFNDYTDPCDPDTAPPDTNIKEFTYSTAFPWMSKPPTGQSAETREYNNKLMTIADIPADQIPSTTTGGMYGPLWVFAKAVIKDNGYQVPEPDSGYNKFAVSNWSTLYTPGAQQAKSSPTYPSTPYTQQLEPPVGRTGVGNRRVLNVPLLRCPAPSNAPPNAEVLAVAKFFMTVSATADDLHAEFAGLAPPKTLVGHVKLYP